MWAYQVCGVHTIRYRRTKAGVAAAVVPSKTNPVKLQLDDPARSEGCAGKGCFLMSYGGLMGNATLPAAADPAPFQMFRSVRVRGVLLLVLEGAPRTGVPGKVRGKPAEWRERVKSGA